MDLAAVFQGKQALLYMERYVDEGARTYSSLAGQTEAAPRYRPERDTPAFELVAVDAPRDRVSVFRADPSPGLLQHFVRPQGVLFAVHPETWANDAVEGLGDIRALPRTMPIRVAPTASTRTVLALEHPENVPGYFLKLHYPVRISRFNRELRLKNIHNSVAVSRDLANLQFEKFAYLPDTLGVAFRVNEKSWGFLVRETRARPFAAGRFLIPCFALYAGDLNHPDASPLLVQMIDRMAAEPVSFVVDRILAPVVECWARAARERGILLESHAQNTLLEIDRDCVPRRVVHRDFDVWVDPGARRRAGLGMPFLGRGMAADTDEAVRQHYSLVYDQFIGHHFFDYVAGVLKSHYGVDEEIVRARVREVFHHAFPDADRLFPVRTMFKFRTESPPNRNVLLEDMRQPPVWR
ncbi:IucA/IucC family C-terminal-domain containing protein [Microvirga sp. TS319]|uniref:IucA/IucC family C-terminal-domain containing protein n=1 Tax=Microvirga sp. TS319 TaxID=3241165 RepID=UPI00351AAC2F